MSYLLAAEADRIQDLVFRSSSLREVVGGSQLLSRFCDEVPVQLAARLGIDAQAVTSGGGSFHIKVTDREQRGSMAPPWRRPTTAPRAAP